MLALFLAFVHLGLIFARLKVNRLQQSDIEWSELDSWVNVRIVNDSNAGAKF